MFTPKLQNIFYGLPADRVGVFRNKIFASYRQTLQGVAVSHPSKSWFSLSALTFFFVNPAQAAFTCVPVVAQWGTISYINTNQASCSAGEWSVFTPADLSAYNASLQTAAASGVNYADVLAALNTTNSSLSVIASGVQAVPVNASVNFQQGALYGAEFVGLLALAWGVVAVSKVLR